MPWSQTSPMDQRTQFIADYLREVLSVTELCDLYGVSRKTAYKWIDRYLRQGPAGLEERSRRPQGSPNQTPEEIVAAILEARRRHPSWGGKKLLVLVHKRHRNWDLPHRSTVCDILQRHGMVPKQRSRRRIGHPGKPTSSILAPNDLWSADYKGQFKTGDGRYCYPLTVTDSFSRYLLGCQGLSSTAVAEAKPVFTRLFKEYGLPRRIRTDNGVPFATNTLARLSSLSAWWVRLWESCLNSSNRGNRSRTGAMSACTEPSKTRLRALRRQASPHSNESSMSFAKSSTTSDRTRPWISKHPLPATAPQRAKCPRNSRRWNIRTGSKCATSVPTAASAGTEDGSTSPPSASANTWVWRKSTTASGTCTSDRSSSGGSSNDT
jgi:transposase